MSIGERLWWGFVVCSIAAMFGVVGLLCVREYQKPPCKSGYVYVRNACVVGYIP